MKAFYFPHPRLTASGSSRLGISQIGCHGNVTFSEQYYALVLQFCFSYFFFVLLNSQVERSVVRSFAQIQ